MEGAVQDESRAMEEDGPMKLNPTLIAGSCLLMLVCVLGAEEPPPAGRALLDSLLALSKSPLGPSHAQIKKAFGDVDPVPAIAQHRQEYPPADRRRFVYVVVGTAESRKGDRGPYTLRDKPSAGVLVESLADPDAYVRRDAARLLTEELAPALCVELAEQMADNIALAAKEPDRGGPRPLIGRELLLLGRTGTDRAREMILSAPMDLRRNVERTKLARARLGDKECETFFLEKFSRKKNPDGWYRYARALGYIGSEAACRALAGELRAPEVEETNLVRSVRVYVVRALSRAHPDVEVLWDPNWETVDKWEMDGDNVFYERIEQWARETYGVRWDRERPDFLWVRVKEIPLPMW